MYKFPDLRESQLASVLVISAFFGLVLATCVGACRLGNEGMLHWRVGKGLGT